MHLLQRANPHKPALGRQTKSRSRYRQIRPSRPRPPNSKPRSPGEMSSKFRLWQNRCRPNRPGLTNRAHRRHRLANRHRHLLSQSQSRPAREIFQLRRRSRRHSVHRNRHRSNRRQLRTFRNSSLRRRKKNPLISNPSQPLPRFHSRNRHRLHLSLLNPSLHAHNHSVLLKRSRRLKAPRSLNQNGHRHLRRCKAALRCLHHLLPLRAAS